LRAFNPPSASTHPGLPQRYRRTEDHPLNYTVNALQISDVGCQMSGRMFLTSTAGILAFCKAKTRFCNPDNPDPKARSSDCQPSSRFHQNRCRRTDVRCRISDVRYRHPQPPHPHRSPDTTQ
jgi:hypothetical protein